MVEGVHFDWRFVPPEAVGYRALAVNLSDLAAMGAEPRAAVLSLALPDGAFVDTVDRFLDGFLGLAAQHRTALIGGNITRTPGRWVVDVTALGSVRPRRILSRAGARPGDAVYVTGSPGSAAIGLQLLRAAADSRPGCGHSIELAAHVRTILAPRTSCSRRPAAGAEPCSVELHGPQRRPGGRVASDGRGLRTSA